MSADAAAGPLAGSADRALQVIEAQRQADALVEQVRAGELDAEGLAIELAKAYGHTLQALARAIAKAIERTTT